MKLFPYSLLRIAGSSYDKLELLEVKDSVLSRYFDQKEDFKKLKEKIDSFLYDLIGSQNHKDKQNLLLNFKRDVYNDRNISSDTLSEVFETGSDELKSLIQSYFSLSDEIKAVKERGEELFSKEIAINRGNFQLLLEEESFQKGLLLSSKSLLKGLDSYRAKENGELSRSDLKAEQGALKYVTRMRTKTSPFSTFTNLSVAEHKGQSNGAFFDGYEQQRGINSHVRLNNYLFRYLKAVMLKYSAIYEWLLLRPNPTIQKKDSVFVYLTNNDNIESFQRMEVNPLLDLLLDKLSGEKQGIVFRNVIEILKEYVDATQEDLENYVNDLVQYGFLEFNLGVSGIDTEWDIKLGSKLEKLEKKGVPLTGELRTSLSKLREFARKFEKANVTERSEILTEAFDEFKTVALKLHKAAGLPEEERMNRKELIALRKKQKKENEDDENTTHEKLKKDKETPFKHKSNTYFNLKPKNIFYEDTTLKVSTEVSKEKVEDFIGLLNDLLNSLSFLKGRQDEKDKMAHFFKETYKKSDEIDLFSFYEDYYREVKKPEAEQQRVKSKKNKGKDKNDKDTVADKSSESKIESIQDRKELLEKWISSFKSRLDESDLKKGDSVLNIDQKQIDAVNVELDLKGSQKGRNSFGAFVQFFQKEGGSENPKLKGIVNSTFGGFGKMISRFLHLFNDDVRKELNSWNNSLANGELLLENNDASYFNANLHPPLMPNEIWIPGGHNSLSEEKQIPVTDLGVKFNEEKDELELFHKSNKKRVYIFDLGFQGIKGRSQLFQMLSNFTLMEYFFYSPVLQAANKWIASDKAGNQIKEVIEYPRVEYEDTIVLQRKRWNAPKGKLPQRTADESDWDYFVKVNEWRRKLNIPKEVFVFVMSRYSNGKLSKKKRQKVSRDDYKPQYINFNNPLLVSLFEKLVRKVPFAMKIEEMLPDSDQLMKIGDKRFVTEFMVQWYNFNKTGDSVEK